MDRPVKMVEKGGGIPILYGIHYGFIMDSLWIYMGLYRLIDTYSDLYGIYMEFIWL